MYNSEKEKTVFCRAIRKLTFTPCIELRFLNESIRENKASKKVDTLDGSNTPYRSTRDSIERLLTILSCPTPKKDEHAKTVMLSKIYDEDLEVGEIHLYNTIANKIGMPVIPANAPSLKTLIEIAKLDGGDPDNDIVAQYYPYYYGGKRDGVSFIEYILLHSISLVTHHRTKTWFEKQLNNLSDPDGISKWKKTVINSMRSPSSYMSYVNTFFGILNYEVATEMNFNADLLNDAFEKSESESVFYEDLFFGEILYEAKGAYSSAEILFKQKIPVIWQRLRCELEFGSNENYGASWWNLVDEEISDSCEKYKDIIKLFINQSICKAEAIITNL